jgi:glycosyltransferase involved in cell wall biosynthesis
VKVLIVVPSIAPLYGGTSKLAIELAEALGESGVEADLITTDADGKHSLDVPIENWIDQGAYRIRYFARSIRNEFKLSYSLTRWLWQHVQDYDVVHLISLFTYPIAIAHWLCRLRGIPYVINPQGMLEPWAMEYKAWKKQIYYNLIEKPALQRTSTIQMLSQAEADGIRSLNLQAPILISPNGIDQREFETPIEAEIFYQQFESLRGKTLILFLGRVDPKKGLDLLAPAFSQVHQQFPNTHLVIAGPDNINFQPTAEHYFEQSGCREAVTFTGMLTGALKYAVLSASTLYVAPSYSEGFSLSVLEGMAAGLPCVITTGCNFPEAGNAQAATIVDPDADQIACALITLLLNQDTAQQMGDRARHLIFDHYTWAQIAAQLIQTYSGISHVTPCLQRTASCSDARDQDAHGNYASHSHLQ